MIRVVGGMVNTDGVRRKPIFSVRQNADLLSVAECRSLSAAECRSFEAA